MAEEHRCQAPRLCANNCGFFGCPATQDLCSKCYRDLQLKEHQSSNVKLALNQSLSSSTVVSIPSSSALALEDEPVAAAAVASPPAPAAVEGVAANRCSTCRRRVGLTGFKCRCGMTYCGAHRYPEQHACGFDFKAMGREQISKANPLVKADKLDKI